MKQLKSYIIVATLALILPPSLEAQSNSGQRAGKRAGEGALIGALAGAIFGSGDVLGDAAEGALIGGGIGALTGALEGGSMDRREREEMQKLVNEFGEDNLRGYIELMQCNHDKAIALFKVGEMSNVTNHKLAALWLQSIAEKDRKNLEEFKDINQLIIDNDPDIDDMQQASMAIDQYVLTLREDRRANNLPSCNR